MTMLNIFGNADDLMRMPKEKRKDFLNQCGLIIENQKLIEVSPLNDFATVKRFKSLIPEGLLTNVNSLDTKCAFQLIPLIRSAYSKEKGYIGLDLRFLNFLNSVIFSLFQVHKEPFESSNKLKNVSDVAHDLYKKVYSLVDGYVEKFHHNHLSRRINIIYGSCFELIFLFILFHELGHILINASRNSNNSVFEPGDSLIEKYQLNEKLDNSNTFLKWHIEIICDRFAIDMLRLKLFNDAHCENNKSLEKSKISQKTYLEKKQWILELIQVEISRACIIIFKILDLYTLAVTVKKNTKNMYSHPPALLRLLLCDINHKYYVKNAWEYLDGHHLGAMSSIFDSLYTLFNVDFVDKWGEVKRNSHFSYYWGSFRDRVLNDVELIHGLKNNIDICCDTLASENAYWSAIKQNKWSKHNEL